MYVCMYVCICTHTSLKTLCIHYLAITVKVKTKTHSHNILVHYISSNSLNDFFIDKYA